MGVGNWEGDREWCGDRDSPQSFMGRVFRLASQPRSTDCGHGWEGSVCARLSQGDEEKPLLVGGLGQAQGGKDFVRPS